MYYLYQFCIPLTMKVRTGEGSVTEEYETSPSL